MTTTSYSASNLHNNIVPTAHSYNSSNKKHTIRNNNRTENVHSSRVDYEEIRSEIKKNNSKSNSDNYFFELFGLKLYFDDVLLICLIFFLYDEGVRDNELFISLILLLLS